ncbi:MAG: cyclase family protein [Pseudomonadota bacterium]
MRLVDLSRTLETRTPTHPAHPPVTMMVWNDHDEVKEADGVRFTSKSLFMTLGDHAGTHVDAFCHFDGDPAAPSIDQMPLERFYTEAICLDLSHIPLQSDVSIDDLKAAEAASGETIQAGDTVFLHLGFNDRVPLSDPRYLTHFSGLTQESATWLCGRGIVSFGVEAVSPARPGGNNFLVHQVCRDTKVTHMESLVNLRELVGKGRFRFIGFPLKIKGGTGSPIRAVAVLDD